MFDQELESFKTGIDLRGYAAGQGYQLDRKESWRGSAVMRHPVTDDKIVIKRATGGHYLYFSVRDDTDNGSIIDFVQFRQGVSLGAVRKELRPWIGQPPVAVPTFSTLHRTEKDRMKVEEAYARTQKASDGHAYLERERALPSSVLESPRFAGRIRREVIEGIKWANAVFPHFDQKGLCGYEIKNREFTGFAKGGTKGLWLSRTQPDDDRLVFCESAIDALSHAALFPADHTRYASIGGKPNPEQPGLVLATIVRMPTGSEIVGAMDSDDDGDKLNGVVRQAVEFSGRGDLRFVLEVPTTKDWNDALRAKQPDFFRMARVSGLDIK